MKSTTYLGALSATNYQVLTNTARLKSNPPNCNQNTAALQMGVSLSGFQLNIAQENVKVGNFFSYGFWVYITSPAVTSNVVFLLIEILNIFGVVLVSIDNSVPASPKIVQTWTLNGGSIVLQSNLGAAGACDVDKWCYIAGQLARNGANYEATLFGTKVTGATTTSSSAPLTGPSPAATSSPVSPSNVILIGGSTALPFVNSFDGYIKDIRVYRSPLSQHILLNQAFDESAIYGSDEFLSTYIKVNDTNAEYMSDYGRVAAKYPVPKSRLVSVTTTPTFCTRRYFYECLTVPDFAQKAVVPDTSYLSKIAPSSAKYFNFVSGVPDTRVFQYLTADYVSLSEDHCSRGIPRSGANFTGSSLSTDGGEILGGIGPGFYKICIYSDIEETFYHIGSFNVPESPWRNSQSVQILLQTAPQTGFILEIAGDNSFSVGDSIHFATSCDKLVPLAPATITANYLSATKTANNIFIYSYLFSSGASDLTRLERGTLHLCLKPTYYSTAFPMFETLFGSSMQLSSTPGSLPSLGLAPAAITHINRNIHSFVSPGIENMFADFEELTFVDCSVAGSENTDATCTSGVPSDPILIQDGVV